MPISVRGNRQADRVTDGLIVAVVEAISDTLSIQAVRVMDSGCLDGDQRERLGRALLDLENAIENIKKEPGIARSLRTVRTGPKCLVDDIVRRIVTN
jgi:hypothetical protein